FKNMYSSWMENVRDWCISRQLWWGHRIPAFYVENEIFVARSKEEAARQASEKLGRDVSMDELRQDEDVLDTWFSSWLWPISVFDGFKDPDNEDILYYYPTNDLVTAPEILFFWVARMIMAGYEYRGEAPFRNVYLTGIVRDTQGRKMSKSLGNSPDPLDLIEKYGADGVRVGMLFSSPAGNDLLFDEKLCEQGRNFSNKIWNALRLVTGWEVVEKEEPANQIAIDWFDSVFNQTLRQIDDHFAKFRMSDALMSVYKLVWDDFCSGYLEMIKPAYQQPIDKHTYEVTLQYFEQLIRVLHPFMPFITEEIWHTLKERKPKEYLVVDKWPVPARAKADVLQQMQIVLDAVAGIRGLRNSKGMPQTKPVELVIQTAHSSAYNQGLIEEPYMIL
ncbi:MAG: valine--tRNA ligase, partial [Sphingobacteriales bacterium]